MKVFFNYSIDCELPPDGKFGGPATWESAEASTRGFVALMDELGLRKGASLFVYPDVAMKQRALYREMAEAGVETALHLNGMRYSRMKRPAWLGSLSYKEQLDAYRMAKADLEDATGKPCLGYRACYASANHYTFPALEDAGFVWTSVSACGNHRPEVFECWSLAWRFPHHTSRVNRFIPGDMKLYDVPIQRGIHARFEGSPDRFLDARAETPPAMAGPNQEMFGQIIEENLNEMERCDQPVRVVMSASHNTNPYADRASFQCRNVIGFCRQARDISEGRGYDFVPASFMEVKQEADVIGAF